MNMSEYNEMLSDLKRSGIDINSTSREDIVNQAMSEHGIPLMEILENFNRDAVLEAVYEAMIAYNAIVDEEEEDEEDEEEEDNDDGIVFDTNGRIISEFIDDQLVVYTYDEKGNLITETYPDGTEYRREYDDRNNMIKSINTEGSISMYEYNDNNKLIKYIYPDGRTVSYVRDSNDVLVDTIHG